MATTDPFHLSPLVGLFAACFASACAVGPKDLVSDLDRRTPARIEQALELVEDLSGPTDERALTLHRELRSLALYAPRDAQVRTALAVLAYELGNENEAARELDAALSLEAGNPVATALRTQLLLAEGNSQRAQRLLEVALLHHPEDPELHLAMAQVAHLDGEPELALAALDRADQLGAQVERTLLATGLVLEQAGDLDRARDIYDQLLEVNPRHAQALARRTALDL